MPSKRELKEKREKREKKEKKEKKGGKVDPVVTETPVVETPEATEATETETPETETETPETETPVVEVEDTEGGKYKKGGAGAAEAAIAAFGGPGEQRAVAGEGNRIAVNVTGGKGWFKIPTSFLSKNKSYKKRTSKSRKNKGKKSRRTYKGK
jgi:hypothetical protein